MLVWPATRLSSFCTISAFERMLPRSPSATTMTMFFFSGAFAPI